jgi:hypothetical protein
VINGAVTKLYQITYEQAPYIWLYAVLPYWIQRDYVAGVYYNPGLLGYYYPLIYYNATSAGSSASIVGASLIQGGFSMSLSGQAYTIAVDSKKLDLPTMM